MTLRARLIAAFTSTVLLSIVVFGYITYMTFFTDKIGDKREIFHLYSESALLALGSETEHEVNRILAGQLSQPPGVSQQANPDSQHGSGLLSLVEITSWPSSVSSDSGLSHFQRLAFNLDLANRGPRAFNSKGQLYLLWPLPEQGASRRLMVMRYDEDRLHTLIDQVGELDKGMVKVNLENQHLFSLDRLDEKYRKKLSEEAALFAQVESKKNQLLDVGDFYLFVPETQVYGFQFSYLTPKVELLQSAIAFKDRILTALVVLGWISLWIVLIIAYRITRPLGVLDQATRDMISYNYETPVKITGGGREVQSLSVSFETMRRKIKDLVVHDALTGLYNRRYLMHTLELAVGELDRGHEPLSCIMIDLDFFKSVNDRFGHQAGDEVLRTFGQLMRNCTRTYDVAARYGGEEFTLILPRTDKQTAQQVAERLRGQVEQHHFEFQGQRIPCTISLGLACFEDHGDPPEKLLDRADQALYAAKQQGRNRVVSC